MIECTTCGSHMPDNSPVCTDCGMDLTSAATPSVSAPAVFNPALPPVADVSESFASGLATPPVQVPATAPTPIPAAVPGLPPAPVHVALTPPATPVVGGTGMSATLTLKRGGAVTSEIFFIAQRGVVGRFDPDSGPIDVDLGSLPEASYVSRHHAEIWCTGGQWFVKDLGSVNKTFVKSGSGKFNQAAVDQPIQDGDEIAFGNARFEFHIS